MIEAHLRYLLGPAQTGSLERSIANLGARYGVVEIAGERVPYTERRSGQPAGKIASPAVALGFLGASQKQAGAGAIQRVRNQSARLAGNLLIWSGVDRLPLLYNTPFSCNPLALPEAHVAALCALDPREFPGGGFAIRGLVERLDGDAIARLRAAQFVLAPYRRTFLVDPSQPGVRRARHLAQDSKLADKYGHTIRVESDFSPEEVAAIAAFYRALYIGKYSAANADYTAAFFEACAVHGLTEFLVARDGAGALAGFANFCETDAALYNVGVGYAPDATAPIYRMLMAAVAEEARARGKILNWGGGVARFKTLRRARPSLEYFAFRVASRRMRLVLAVMQRAYERAANDEKLLAALDL